MSTLEPFPGTAAEETPAFRRQRRAEERVTVLGARMDLVRAQEVFKFVEDSLSSQTRAVVANHNFHSLYLCRKNSDAAAFFESADLVQVDSIPLIFWARLTGHSSRRFHRCTYLDWSEAFWSSVSANGWRVYFLGGEPGVGEAARRNIRERWPQIKLATRQGFFDENLQSAENADVLNSINDFDPDILLVGMGMPRQEVWIHQNLNRLPHCVIFTIGGAFDYEAGVQVACPRIIGQLGLEWLFRFFLHPRRLFFRYCIEPVHLIGPAIGDLANMARRREAARNRFFSAS